MTLFDSCLYMSCGNAYLVAETRMAFSSICNSTHSTGHRMRAPHDNSEIVDNGKGWQYALLGRRTHHEHSSSQHFNHS